MNGLRCAQVRTVHMYPPLIATLGYVGRGPEAIALFEEAAEQFGGGRRGSGAWPNSFVYDAVYQAAAVSFTRGLSFRWVKEAKAEAVAGSFKARQKVTVKAGDKPWATRKRRY